MTDIITEVSKYQKGWTGGLPETPCGNGSRIKTTLKQREWLPKLIKEYKIRTIADIGAGDLNWIKHTDLCGAEYTPYDLVVRDKDVVKFNLLDEIPPEVDLIMCLWVLNHFPFDHAREAFENIQLSGAKYLLITHRDRYKKDEPPELDMEYIDRIVLNEKKDDIRFVKL